MPLEVKRGQGFKTECCLNGHHLDCNKHDPVGRGDLVGHDFIALSYDKYSILAVALTTSGGGFATKRGCLYRFEPDDIQHHGRLDHSMVRFDCFCRINREHVMRVENTIISNVGIRKIIKKMEVFVTLG